MNRQQTNNRKGGVNSYTRSESEDSTEHEKPSHGNKVTVRVQGKVYNNLSEAKEVLRIR